VPFWKAKYKRTVEEVAADLLGLANGVDASEHKGLKDAGFDLDRTNHELFYLRLFAVESALFTHAAGPSRKDVIDTYLSLLDRFAGRVGEDGETFLSEIAERRRRYVQAASTAHKLGPAYQIGKAFCDLCGGDHDFLVVTAGSVEFYTIQKAVEKYLNGVTVQD
jgi:hypothetical protein